MTDIRNNWTHEEVKEIYNLPLLDLVNRASNIHRQYHDSTKMNMNTLISVRTGACSQDCKYCAQSARYNTHVKPEKLSLEQVIADAKVAKANGVKRVCLSSAGRDGNRDDRFNEMAEMITEVKKLGLEVCCTMGMINKEKAKKLADLGITAVNHNLDTSERHYPTITTTRTYAERLETLANLQEAGINYCSGGILGMGEDDEDRIEMLRTLSNQAKHPYNVPLNALVPVEGTPFYGKDVVDIFEMVRAVAIARILMPKAVIAFAAGRTHYSKEGQALCFMAGANSIFFGNKLLTVGNVEINEDQALLETLGMQSTKYHELTTLEG
ncbi:biotin synthase BioB [Ancylomarina euxinus]|uniref:Biotin synthase n=1 Tax=Ancylomarina euxinus TaxID=2283627 RepID=A0A425Y6M9_9BACT|nr:biotin synthase BioB [Ancylomarina euxinus]MCZ4694140.1 biotin synthase BioB [Ancylomarina euxinus]MUP15806.1 biotin synthase BioB [Ancylomarina euxinus]RRG23990.1 biotin synthase BioB [Ancylomarina euxinus]